MTLAIVGGYRLVRRVGTEGGADLWIGAPAGAKGTPVVVKLYRSDWSIQRVSAEIEALARAAGPHVVAVRDICTTVDGRTALVLDRLSTHSLGGLLAARGSVTPGEAVTILAPLAQALSRVHRAGVAHRGLRASAVAFSQHGAPTLTSFDDALVLPAGLTRAQREENPAILEDARAFRLLCEETVNGLATADPIRAWLDENGSGASWVDDLPARLFSWSASVPVDLDAPVAAGSRAELPGELRRSRSARTQPLGMLARVAELGERDWSKLLQQHLRAVRPRFWAMGSGVLGTLVLTAVLLPGVGSGATARGGAPSGTTGTSATITEAPTNADAAAVASDDPVAALAVLLDTRSQCIRDLSILCLDAVAQHGSAALAEDQQLIRALQEGGSTRPELFDGELVVSERLGGAALVTVTPENAEPASILLVRSEAGWRIRDYVG